MAEVDDTSDQYLLGARGVTIEVGLRYREDWSPSTSWQPAAHHSRSQENYYLQRQARLWDHLAVSIVLRDRHFLSSLRELVTKDAE